MYSILQGTSGAGGGSSRVVKMTGGFWDEAYNGYVKEPYNLPSVLHGWSHELGRAFGLLHTEDARTCFANHGVDLGALPTGPVTRFYAEGRAGDASDHVDVAAVVLSDSLRSVDALSIAGLDVHPDDIGDPGST
ncbi:MAG: hypothetical protein H7066_12815 [Cytophagaceae bacterium]|nr:hypothetical protein [Gemmatimonadaceae bacterium]